MSKDLLSPEQKAFLKDLSHHPTWGQILERLEEQYQPLYKPWRSAGKGDSQQNSLGPAMDWAYDSGRSIENKRVLTILRGET